MVDKKWYYGYRYAEGEALFFIELTNEGADIIRRFVFEQTNGPDTKYSGGFNLSKDSFSSKEEAIAYTKNKYDWIWADDKFGEEEFEEDEES